MSLILNTKETQKEVTTSLLEGVREEDLPGDRRGKVVCLSATALVSSSAEGECSSSDGNLQSLLETLPYSSFML